MDFRFSSIDEKTRTETRTETRKSKENDIKNFYRKSFLYLVSIWLGFDQCDIGTGNNKHKNLLL